MHFVWNHTGVKFANLIPDKLRLPLGALLVVAVIVIGTFATAESQDNTRAVRVIQTLPHRMLTSARIVLSHCSDC